jgi:dipeptidyl aminopeptidase/acylaminoacyl peptidase
MTYPVKRFGQEGTSNASGFAAASASHDCGLVELRALYGFVVVLFVLLCHPLRAQSKHIVTLHDLQSLEDASYLQVSPLGDYVAYVWKEYLWISSTQRGSFPRQFAKAKVPLWAPDGTKLAYYSDESGTTQLWVLDVQTEKVEQVTSIVNGIDPDPATAMYWFYDPLRFSWSPDSTKLVFASRVNAKGAFNKDVGAQVLSGEVRDTDGKPLVLTTSTPSDWTLKGIFRSATNPPLWTAQQQQNDLLLPKKASELFVVDLHLKKVSQLTQDHAGYYHPAWSPDGRTIACVSVEGVPLARRKALNTNVYLIDVSNGKKTILTRGSGEKRVPTWSPDGRWIAYLGRHGFGQQSVFLIAADGRSKPRRCTYILHRHVLDFHWWPDSKSIVAVNVDGVSWPITRINILTNRVEFLDGREPSHRWPVSVSSTGDLVWQQSDGIRMGAIFVRKPADSDRHLLIDLNPQVKQWELGKQEIVRWKNRRGDDKEGVLIKPVGYVPGHLYPLIVDGYPHIGIGFLGSAMFGNQAWASRGYAVFFPDARAPHVYENHFKTELIDQAGRGPHGWEVAVDDVMSGVDELVRRRIADPNRMALYGFSNGGGVVNYLVTRTRRFKCAISVAGALSDWLRPFFLETDSQVPLWAGGITPFNDPQGYIELSAVFRLDKAVTPMLLADGDDDGVFLLNTVEMYNGLRWFDRDVTLLRYPGQGHGFTGASMEDFWVRENSFLDSHLNPNIGK